jgi:hypothetical protein
MISKLNKLSSWLLVNDFKKESLMVNNIILIKESEFQSQREKDLMLEAAKKVVRERCKSLSGEEKERCLAEQEEAQAAAQRLRRETEQQPQQQQGQPQGQPQLRELDAKYAKWSSVGSSDTNFHKVEGGNNLYRSALPIQSTEFFSYLKQKYGITNIVNLTRTGTGREAEYVKAAGMRYLPGVTLGTHPPNDAQWKSIKTYLDGGNTLVHCTHGADRTGAIIARWKIEKGKSNPQAALQEALTYGFKDQDQVYNKGKDNEIKDPNRLFRAWILAGRGRGAS